MSQSSEILQKYLNLKKEKQPAFSMRGLAKRLELSPSYLSRIFNGQKSVPLNRVQQFIEALDIDDTGEAQFRRTLLVDKALDSETQKAIQQSSQFNINEAKSSEKFTEISGKKTTLLDEWYYIPILDLISCEGFVASSDWIGKKLGLKESVVEKAWQRLVQLNCIENVEGTWRKVDGNIRIPTTKTHPSVRRYHQNCLKKAFEEIATHTQQSDFDSRCFKAATVAGNPKNFTKAKKILDDALFEAISILSENEPTDIFQVGFQVFPLSKD